MDALQQIIQSLVPVEKRYFKMFAGAFKDDSNLVKLFSALDELPGYNEEKIRKATGIKDLTKAKSNLRKLLLKAMRNYREDRGVVNHLRNWLNDIDFLMRKGLNEEARKEIHKALKISEKYELHNYTMDMMVLLGKIEHRTMKKDKMWGDFDLRIQQLNDMQAKQHDINTALLYNQELSVVLRTRTEENFPDGYFKGLIQKTMEQLSGNRSVYGRFILLINLAVCYQVGDRQKDAEKTYDELRRMFKQTPELMHINPKAYLSVLINYGIISSYTRHLEKISAELLKETEESFTVLKDFFEDDPDQVIYYRERLTGNKLSHCKTNAVWNMLPGLEEEVKRHLVGNHEKVVAALQTAGLISCFFSIDNYKKTLEWVNIYYTLDDAKSLRPLMLCVRALEVFAYHGIGQFDLSDTKAINLYKTLIEQKFTSEYHKHLGTMLRKLNHWQTGNGAHKKEIRKLSAAFTKLKQEKRDEIELYEEYFDAVEILGRL